MLKQAKNGCNKNISFLNKQVYFDWDINSNFQNTLGRQINIDDYIQSFINNNISNTIKKKILYELLIDWKLYENGWLIQESKNPKLFYYLCQITYEEPKYLKHINYI